MTPTVKKGTRVWPVLAAYYRAASRYPWLLLGVFAAGLAIEAVSVVATLIMSRLIDTVAVSVPSAESLATLYWFVLLFLCVALFGWCAQRLRMFAIFRIEARVMADLSNQAFHYLLDHSYDFFVSNFAGTLTRRVTRYARAFEQVLDGIVFQFFSTFVFASGVIIVLSIRNIWIGLALFTWTIVFVWVQIALTKWRQPLRVTRAEEDSKVTGALSDAVSNHSTISLFATENHERSLFSGAIARWYDATMRSWRADGVIYAVQGLLAIGIEIALLGGGVYLWSQGQFAVGDFVLIQVYIIGLIDRIWNLGNGMRKLYDAFADAYEMIVILETPHGVKNAQHSKELVIQGGAITFDSVGFNFNETRNIFTDLNLSIQAGERVALVGPSGAGKSTVTKLLLRLYDLTTGEIRIDGQNIAEVRQESLRKAMAFVPQEPVLFHRSLMDNIRYGRLDATDAEVIEAARKAHCHEFIAGLTNGYDTHVGERGIKLSGGERQRVAIARAILKNAPILIMDEATSSLDSESEHLIQEALDVLMEGKTVIVIAHRLSTVLKMDRILVIENGRVAAQGTHEELLKEQGLYHKLWNIQAGGFLE